MARKRMEEPTIKNWEETDDVMKKLLESQLEVEKIEANMNKKIAEIKKAAEEMARPYKDNIKKNELLLKEFVTVHKSELDGKSRKMNFGIVGFRLSTKVVLPKMIEAVLENLKKFGMHDCINIKETVNKDILKTYEPDVIISVGGTLKTEDTFWYETKRDALSKE